MRMMAQGEVGCPVARLGAGGKLLVAGAPAPGAAKPALPGPTGARAVAPADPIGGVPATGRGAEAERCANMTSGGMRSSNTTTMRSRRRLVDSTLTA